MAAEDLGSIHHGKVAQRGIGPARGLTGRTKIDEKYGESDTEAFFDLSHAIQVNYVLTELEGYARLSDPLSGIEVRTMVYH
jgi:hypothetical protein